MTCFRMGDGKSVYRFCKENNYNYFSFFYAMEKGDSFDQALDKAKNSKEVGKSHPKHYYKGKAVVRIFGYKTKAYDRIRHWIERGYSVEEAVERELNRTHPVGRPQNKPKIFYNGTSLVSLFPKKADYSRVLRRIRKGMSIESSVAIEGV